MGERGSGKSWQLLRFAMEALELHRRDPWGYGPVFLVKLRALVNLIEHASCATPVLCQYVMESYPEITTAFGDVATLGALFGTGHAVLCVDGFDEMDTVPTDARVRTRLTSLLLLLSKRTRFVLSCRPGHFSSLSALYRMPAWAGSTIGNTFEILEFLPFDEQRQLDYVQAAGRTPAETVRRLFGFDMTVSGPLQRALSICGGHPALLAAINDSIEKGVENPVELMDGAIANSIIRFNVMHGRTQEDYQLPDGEWVSLPEDRRVELLCDLAWHMAVREIDVVDLAHLPPRIRLVYRILDSALQRDLRSQTVLELVNEPDAQQAVAVDGDEGSELADGEHGVVESKSLVRFTLRNPHGEGKGIGETSVTGALFLGRYLLARLTEPGPFGMLPSAVRLRCLGRVALAQMGSAMLNEMLQKESISTESLAHDAQELLVGLARTGNYGVFAADYRHLIANLSLLGAFSEHEARQLDPWCDEIVRIVRPPERLPGYKLVLVPPYPQDIAENKGSPFLLGVHEVTNDNYRCLVACAPEAHDDDCTVQGRQWSVSRVTVAGSGSEENRSENHRLTNEYHLFYWLPTGASSPRPLSSPEHANNDLAYIPATETIYHPVTYVSWYAAAAFCDWLSLGDARPRRYARELFTALDWTDRLSPLPETSEPTGYRMATPREWSWAARGGHEDLLNPWEAFPYYLPKADRLQDRRQHCKKIVDQDAWGMYKYLQHIMKQILLIAGKQAREVRYDEPNDFGLSGMVGNVREWSDARPDSGVQDEHVILGATAFLGEGSFNFEYKTSLYPRNTNPDVGFRIARSLSRTEVELLSERQSAIALLGN